MLDLAAASQSLRQSRRSSLERLANSRSRQVALFGAAALAIFSAGQSMAHHSAVLKAPQVMTAKPALPAPVTTRHALPGGGSSRPAQELRP